MKRKLLEKSKSYDELINSNQDFIPLSNSEITKEETVAVKEEIAAKEETVPAKEEITKEETVAAKETSVSFENATKKETSNTKLNNKLDNDLEQYFTKNTPTTYTVSSSYSKEVKSSSFVAFNTTKEETLYNVVKQNYNNDLRNKTLIFTLLMPHVVAIFKIEENKNTRNLAYSYFTDKQNNEPCILNGHFLCSVHELKNKTNKNNCKLRFIGYGITNEILYKFLETNCLPDHEFDFMRDYIINGINSGYIDQIIIYRQIFRNYKNELFFNRPDLDEKEKNLTRQQMLEKNNNKY